MVIRKFLMKSVAWLSRKPMVQVAPKRLEDFVVDIGAGGEGIIAKICGRQPVGIDISKREIDEARSRGSLAHWILCDASYMPFRNSSFDVATFFFSLMYIKTPNKKQAVFVEVKRVLKSDGLLYLWDATIREKPNLYVVFVEIRLPDGEKIFTGYGVKGKEKAQNLELINSLALGAGFKVSNAESHKNLIEACYYA